MAKVSVALERGLAKQDSASAFARAMRDSIPDSGRPLGAFMARTIDRERGREGLIAAAGDQFGFWLTYHAAAPAGAPRLTPRALGVVRRLAGQ